MTKDYIIWGATGQSLVVEDTLFHSDYKLLAIFDSSESAKSSFENVPIHYKKEGFLTWKKSISTISHISFVVAIGGSRGAVRQELSSYLKNQGLNPMNVISKDAYIAHNASIGSGVQIMPKAVVCAKSIIGDCVLINTSANIDHECVLENGVHIGPGASLAGCVEVGENSFIGTNATILPRIKIGKNVIIGAGAVITKNISDNCIIVGNPGKELIK